MKMFIISTGETVGLFVLFIWVPERKVFQVYSHLCCTFTHLAAKAQTFFFNVIFLVQMFFCGHFALCHSL